VIVCQQCARERHITFATGIDGRERQGFGMDQTAPMPGDAADSDEGVGVSIFKSLVPSVYEIAAEMAEVGIDALVDNVVLDAIPSVRALRTLFGLPGNFREAWLEKKLLAMMYGLGPISVEDSERWQKKLASESGLAGTGERVLALVDRVAAALKAELIGQVMRAWLDGTCDRATFLRTAEMIDNALTEDLVYLMESWTDQPWKEGGYEPAARRLIAAGLMVDRSSAILDETSKLPAPSDEGALLRSLQT